MLRKLLLAALVTALWRSTSGSPKSRSTEDRLNAAMPRIPWPQTDPGGIGNSSYSYSNALIHSSDGTYGSGNTSYQVNTGWNEAGTADNGGVTSGQIGGASAHYHAMSHGHYYGNSASDINAIQYTLSYLVGAYNNLQNSHSNLVATHNGNMDWLAGPLLSGLNTLQGSHSSLLNAHNDLVNRLGNANILQ